MSTLDHTLAYAPPAPRAAADRYLGWLGFVLLGYAIMSRSFAYLGVAPLYVGELTLLAGLLMLARSRGVGLVMRQAPALLLAATMIWGALCTAPHVAEYQIDAFRDAVIWAYGIFAFIVAAILIERPERLKEWLIRYRRFVGLFLGLVWIAFLLHKSFKDALPMMPGAPAKIIEAKGGDILVHLTGVTVFMLVGMMRNRIVLLLLLGLNLTLVLVSNRGGMVAFGLSMTLFLLLKPPTIKMGRFAYGICLMLVLLGLFNPSIQVNGGRSVSLEQMWLNIKSIISTQSGAPTASGLENTEEWRLSWWTKIVDYTFTGEYFWMGKGFGVNLANADGFQVYKDQSLRSPHNGHLTMLARSGVPGFVLWLLTLLTYFGMLLHRCIACRSRGDYRWSGIFLFLCCYWIAAVVNASFDVYLEGPMGGIWFWTAFGTGLAALHIHRHHPEVAWT